MLMVNVVMLIFCLMSWKSVGYEQCPSYGVVQGGRAFLFSCDYIIVYCQAQSPYPDFYDLPERSEHTGQRTAMYIFP